MISQKKKEKEKRKGNEEKMWKMKKWKDELINETIKKMKIKKNEPFIHKESHHTQICCAKGHVMMSFGYCLFGYRLFVENWKLIAENIVTK